MTDTDFKLRLFIDTNLLMDYIHGVRDTNSCRFLRLFERKKPYKHIELATSSYVFWEFAGNMRNELLAQKLCAKFKHGIIGAANACNKSSLEKAKTKDIINFAYTIGAYREKIARIMPILDICRFPDFDRHVDSILLGSKLTYKDSMVYASALCAESHALITRDKYFKGETKKNKFFQRVELKSPAELSSHRLLHAFYKQWFDDNLKRLAIGNVSNHYTNRGILHLSCSKILKSGDYIALIQFKGPTHVMKRIDLKITQMRDFSTQRNCQRGKNVTVKCTKQYLQDVNWKDSMVFKLA